MDLLNLISQNDINYNQYQSNLTKLIEQLSKNKQCSSIAKLLSSQNLKNIYLMLIIFQNYKKWVSIRLDDNNTDNNNIEIFLFNIEQLISENDKKTRNIFAILIQWIYYLYLKLVNILYSNSGQNLSEINIIKYLIKETNYIIVKSYKSKIITTADIFDILYFILFLLETNHEIATYSDNLYKFKNFILLKGIFFILQETAVNIFNRVKINVMDSNYEKNKNDIDEIFSYLEEIQNSEEVNKRNNIIMIINQNIITSFMLVIIKNIDFNAINIYEQNKSGKELSYKNKLINFYAHFLKFNYRKSKLLNQIMDTLKLSFINLYDFANNKNKILQDLFIQGFYIKLLKIIFFFEENSSTKNSSTPFLNSFFFNGFDSEISINFQNNKLLEKSSLFFSFNILPTINANEYPLFSMEKDFDKKDKKELLFNIYLKKVNKTNNIEEYDLYMNKDDSEIKITDSKKIISNITYYLNITFNGNKILISFYNGKNDVPQFELDRPKKLFDSNDINLIFGYNKKDMKSFSGHIGPIIIIKNPLQLQKN